MPRHKKSKEVKVALTRLLQIAEQSIDGEILTQDEFIRLDALIRPKSANPPASLRESIAITDLDLDAVEDIFNLSRSSAAYEWQNKRYQIVEGDAFDESLEMYTRALESSVLKNESLVRSRLDPVIIHTWDQVQRFHHPKGKTRDLVAETEVSLKIKVTHKNKEKVVTGRADYLIRYDKPRFLEVGLVGIEAKSPQTYGASEAQILGYMGMVHTERKALNKPHSTVYGLATDSDRFAFYRINDDGQWTSHELRARYGEGGKKTFKYGEIMNHLAWIYRQAMILSPPSSYKASHAHEGSGESIEVEPRVPEDDVDNDDSMVLYDFAED